MEEVPLKPIGREEIHKLESALLVGTLFRSEVLEALKNPEERLTWVDSLAVAAGALAREKAGMSVTEIAEDLGRSEATIRNHLTGKTKAGKLVRETYDRFAREGVKLEVLEAEKLSKELEKEKKKREELEKKLNMVKETLSDLIQKI